MKKIIASAICVSLFLCSMVFAGQGTIKVEKEWGTVEFEKGCPVRLSLRYGDGKNLLSGSDDNRAAGVYFDTADGQYSSVHDTGRSVERVGDCVVVKGDLALEGLSANKSPVTYEIRWEVGDAGYIRMEAKLAKTCAVEGEVSYKFAFNSRHLNRYYYSGWWPVPVRQKTSFRKVPMDEIAGEGTIFSFDDSVMDRNIGFVRSETEGLSFVAGHGWLSKLRAENYGDYGVVTYVNDKWENDSLNSSFYLLCAPVKKFNSLSRVYVSQHRGVEKLGIKAFVDRMVEEGFRQFIYHETWQLQKAADIIPKGDSNVLYGSHRPQDMEFTRSLIEYAHSKGIKVIFYIGLFNEDSMTKWYKENDGERFKMRDLAYKRKLICMNTEYFDHILEDTGYVFDTLDGDGVFIDWYAHLACYQPHESHDKMPTGNINKLIEYTEFVHSKDKLIYVHSGEEGRLPFIESINDSYVMGERPWSKLDFESTESGVFDRFTSSVGDIAVIGDVRFHNDPEKNQLEVNAALAEGLNPFGYVYRSEDYEVLRAVTFTQKCFYTFDLLKQLRDYEIEDMVFYPANSRIAYSDTEDMVVSLLQDEKQLILFVINKNVNEPAKGQVQVDLSRVKFNVSGNYAVSSKGAENIQITGSDLRDKGFEIEVAANMTSIVFIKLDSPN